MISIQDIYNFFLQYYIDSNYVCFLRFITCTYIIYFFATILKDCLLFIQPNGIFSYNSYLQFCKEKFPQISLYNIYGYSNFWSYFILIIFFVSGITSAIGLFTNISLWIFLLTLVSIQSRIFPIIFTGGDVISRILVLSLCLTKCNGIYSIDYLLGLSHNQNMVDGWAIRLIQITIALGYFGSSLRKLNDNYWLNGEAFHNAINSYLWGRKYNLKLLNYPIVYISINYSLLLFQFFSPVIFFIEETKALAILLGFLFHIGIILFMRIEFFGSIMLISIMYFGNEWILYSYKLWSYL